MFDGCTSLTSVTALSEIESIGDGAFRNCSSLTGIDFPGTLTSIGSSAFQGCASLVSVPNLSKVTKMGSGAFRECKNLRASVDLSSLQSIPGYAFCYTPVKIVGLCDNLKSIGDWAFIQSNVAVQLPRTLETIGDNNLGMFDDSTVQKITIEKQHGRHHRPNVASISLHARNLDGVGGMSDSTKDGQRGTADEETSSPAARRPAQRRPADHDLWQRIRRRWDPSSRGKASALAEEQRITRRRPLCTL